MVILKFVKSGDFVNLVISAIAIVHILCAYHQVH